LWNPSFIKPNLVFKSVEDIPFERLKAAGFAHVLFDKDNTLTDHDKLEVLPQFVPVVRSVQQLFGKEHVTIFSNNLRVGLVSINSRKADIPVLNREGGEKKPFILGTIQSYYREAIGREIDPSKLIVVGDRLLTDVFLANRVGGLSILVLPWNLDPEQLGIRTARLLENAVWSRLFSTRTRPHVNKEVQLIAKDLIH